VPLLITKTKLPSAPLHCKALTTEIVPSKPKTEMPLQAAKRMAASEAQKVHKKEVEVESREQMSQDMSNLGLAPNVPVVVGTKKARGKHIDVAEEFAKRKLLKESLNLVVAGIRH
jgi:hypothetical protein